MSYTNVAVMQPLAICIILSIQVRGAKKNKETPNSFLALHNFAHLQTIFAAKM
jgi:hypothetical protein